MVANVPTVAQRPGAILVGASSGIGAALAAELAQRGYQVALVARREPEMEAIAARLNASVPDMARTYAHDVRDYDAAPALFRTHLRRPGRRSADAARSMRRARCPLAALGAGPSRMSAR